MLELVAGDAVAVVDPMGGGRLTRLAVGGDDLLAPDGCFVMAPWAGRTGQGRFAFAGVEHELPVDPKHAPHAIHGTVRDRAWTVHEATGTEAELWIDLGPAWPWRGTCHQRIRLAPGSITLELAIRTEHDAFPAVAGWHPWFARPERVDLQAAAMLQRGSDGLPTGARVRAVRPGERPLDDAFEDVAWPVVVRWAGLDLTIDASACRYAVLYDEQPHATCVEPQTGPPNGLVTGEHHVVRPSDPLVASTTWRWRRA